jgi:hypothetical protein
MFSYKCADRSPLRKSPLAALQRLDYLMFVRATMRVKSVARRYPQARSFDRSKKAIYDIGLVILTTKLFHLQCACAIYNLIDREVVYNHILMELARHVLLW